MDIRSMAILALLGSTGLTACDKGSDSAGAESDADTDTDSDTDTDTDTDTDVGGPWRATTVSIDASFAYDQTTDSIVVGTDGKKPVLNSVGLFVYNQTDLGGLAPTQFCQFTWEIPTGKVVRDSEFDDKEWWLSFDLSGITPTASGDNILKGLTGDCDGMEALMNVERKDADLITFIQAFDLGFGIHHIDEVSNEDLGNWEDFWPDTSASDTFGDWDDFYENMSAGAMYLDGMSSPNDMDIAVAGLIDPKTWEIARDDDGALVPNSLETAAFAPTAYYATIGMYAYGIQE